jgi:hypothetical protein
MEWYKDFDHIGYGVDGQVRACHPCKMLECLARYVIRLS